MHADQLSCVINKKKTYINFRTEMEHEINEHCHGYGQDDTWHTLYSVLVLLLS